MRPLPSTASLVLTVVLVLLCVLCRLLRRQLCLVLKPSLVLVDCGTRHAALDAVTSGRPQDKKRTGFRQKPT